MELDDIVNKFGNIYTTQIVPKLAVFENKRQQKLKKYKIVKYAQYIVTALFVIALLPFFKFYVGVNGFDKSSCDMLKLIFGLGITAITLIYTWATKIDKDFRNSMKKDMFPIVLQPFGKFKVLNNSERKDKLITLNDIKSLKLYTRAERQSNDDVITGKYKDNEISIVEAELEHTEGSGKHSHTVIFRELF